jgi:hypothetical protein
MTVLLPGFEDEVEASKVSSGTDVELAEEGMVRAERLLAASPSNLTFAGGVAIFLGSNFDRLPLGFPPEAVEGRFLFSWEDMMRVPEVDRGGDRVVGGGVQQEMNEGKE